MTRIYAPPPQEAQTVSPNDQKPAKTEGLFTVLQPTILPVSLPHTTIVKKERKCRFTWAIALILFLWVLATATIIFHLAPDCFYKRLRALTSTDTDVPRVSTSERFVFDIAEPDIKIAPKLPTIQFPVNEVDTVDGTAGEVKAGQQKVKADAKPIEKTENPGDAEATNAIRTLLKRPDVLQVVIVGKTTDPDAAQPTKGVVLVDGSTNSDSTSESDKETGRNVEDEITNIINQLQANRALVVPESHFETTNQQETAQPSSDSVQINNNYMQQSMTGADDYYNSLARYRQAMMRWQMERELQRQQMMMAYQRERAQLAQSQAQSEMPRFMMGPHHPMMMYRIPMYRTPAYHMVFPSQQSVSQQQQQINFDQQTESTTTLPEVNLQNAQRRLDRQFPVQMEADRQNLVPQQQTLPELIRPAPLGQQPVEMATVRPHDASAEQIFRAMQSENVDRDAIYRKLLAQSQMENNRNDQTVQQPEENHDDIFWRLQRISQQRGDVPVPTMDESPMQAVQSEKTPDEIFRELQQRSMQIQKEQELKEKAAKEATRTPPTDDKSAGDQPVIMIADSFPRRSTVPVVDGDAVTSTATPEQPPFEETISDEGNTTDPLAAFFRFFEQEAVKLNNGRDPAVPEITASTRTPTIEPIPELDESSGMEVDQPEPAEGTEPVEAETRMPQEDPAPTEDISDDSLLDSDWNKDQYPLTETENVERPIVRVE